MVGQKYLEKKIGPHACLRVNNYSFLWRPITPQACTRCERALMMQQIVHSKDA